MMNVCPGDLLLNGKGLWAGYVVDNHVISIRRDNKNKQESSKALISAEIVKLFILADLVKHYILIVRILHWSNTFFDSTGSSELVNYR